MRTKEFVDRVYRMDEMSEIDWSLIANRVLAPGRARPQRQGLAQVRRRFKVFAQSTYKASWGHYIGILVKTHSRHGRKWRPNISG